MDFENNVAENQPHNNPAPSQTNGFAIAGFICSFFIAILGLIFSCIGLSVAKKMNGRGKGLACAGLVLSIIKLAFILLPILYVLFNGIITLLLLSSF